MNAPQVEVLSDGLTNHEALDVRFAAFFDTPGPHNLEAFRADLHTLLDAARSDSSTSEGEGLRTRLGEYLERQMNTPWSEGYSEDFKRGYDQAIEEVDAIASVVESRR